MNEYLSRKLKLLSAFSIVMVLYIHMYYTEGAHMPTLNLIESSIGGGFNRTAVPLFYIISGYLFFLKVPGGFRSIEGKMRKRVKTLLIPYIIANIFTFFFYCGINAIALKFGGVSNALNFKIFNDIAALGLWGTLKMVFIDPPVAFQLWFVRDLMVMVFFSPLIWIAMKWLVALKQKGLGWVPPIILSALYSGCYFSGYLGTLFWFMSGGYLAMAAINIKDSVSRPHIVVITGIAVVSSIAWLISGIHPKIAGMLIPLLGVAFLWFAYDLVAKKLKSPVIDWAARFTFFVYLVHEPFLNIFKKIPLLFSRTETTLIVCYLLIPPLFYLIACWIGSILSKLFPNAYKVYTGGR